MGSTLSVPMTHTLLTFDSTRLVRHITINDNNEMVDFIITQYGPALHNALRYFNSSITAHMKQYYDDIYYTATVDENEYNLNHDSPNMPKFFRGTVSESGDIIAKKERYDELVDLCIDTFNGEIAAYLRSIVIDQARQIYTVRVVGYENRTLKLIISTDAPIIP